MLPYVPKQNLPPQSISVWWDCGLQRSQRWTQLHKSMWLKPTLPTVCFYSVIFQGFLAQKSIWTVKPHGFQYKHILNKHTWQSQKDCVWNIFMIIWIETMFIIYNYFINDAELCLPDPLQFQKDALPPPTNVPVESAWVRSIRSVTASKTAKMVRMSCAVVSLFKE